MRTDRVIGKNIGVIGAARSGVAAALLLRRYDANVIVSESRKSDAVAEAVRMLEAGGIECETGGNTERVFDNKDYVVVSPGVPSDAPIVSRIEEAGIPIISEIELGFWMCEGQIVGITGSNGKTTTTMLAGEIFKRSGKPTWVAGNIGSPFCDICDQVSRDGWVILEVSSFQLERCHEFRPRIAVILNLTPDHLDRYGDFASYAEMKVRIGENQDHNDALVVNHDDRYLLSLTTSLAAEKYYFSLTERVNQGVFMDRREFMLSVGGARKLMDISDVSLPGPHNLANCAAAAAASVVAGIPDHVISDVLKSFEGVEHRLEPCGKVCGVNFVNDSKATNVDSVWYALQSIPGRLVMIMGGRDKGGEFSRLRGLVSKNASAVVLIGEAADKIESVLEGSAPIRRAPDMESAVEAAYRLAEPDGTVLLSPGCASFDMFRDFEHRGRAFKSAVGRLREEME